MTCIPANPRSNYRKSRPSIEATKRLAALLLLSSGGLCFGQPDPNWLDHDRDRPLPLVVTPATPSTQDAAGKSPSDAIVLFDGKDLSQWVSMDGSPTKWITRDGYMECVKGSGYVRTLQNFGDCQLHIEWATPVPPEGEGQGRGNSGVFFGLDRYEVQVLDSYGNKTYADGSAGPIYGQYPPLANACLPPGQWQTYDITLVGRLVTVVANGKTVICSQLIPGITGGALIAPAWHRHTLSASGFGQDLAFSTLDQVQNSLLTEFSPDMQRVGRAIRKKLLRK